MGFDGIGNVLFVNTTHEIELIDERDEEVASHEDEVVEKPVEEKEVPVPLVEPEPPGNEN